VYLFTFLLSCRVCHLFAYFVYDSYTNNNNSLQPFFVGSDKTKLEASFRWDTYSISPSLSAL